MARGTRCNPNIVFRTIGGAANITLAINPTTAAAAMSIANFSDVDASGITNGQILVWNSSTNKFEAGDKGAGGGGNSNISLTDFSVTTATPSGNGSLSYNNAGVLHSHQQIQVLIQMHKI